MYPVYFPPSERGAFRDCDRPRNVPPEHDFGRVERETGGIGPI